MIRMSEATRTHTPGQLDRDILISSLARTDQQTNVSLMFRKLRRKIWATKSTYSDQTRNIEKESSI